MSEAHKASLSRIDQAANDLTDYIVKNDLHAGDKLPPEHELTGLLSVGRSTLREAVRMLASRNVLEVRHGAGIFVSDKQGVSDDPFGFAFVRDKRKLVEDLIEFRMMIEPRIAAAAAGAATDAEKAQLRAQCRKIETLIRAHQPYAEEDGQLHALIAVCSRNTIMPKLVPIITDSINLLIEVTGATLGDETIRTHRAIVDAICASDAMAASDAMMLHMIYNRDRLRANPLIAPPMQTDC